MPFVSTGQQQSAAQRQDRRVAEAHPQGNRFSSVTRQASKETQADRPAANKMSALADVVMNDAPTLRSHRAEQLLPDRQKPVQKNADSGSFHTSPETERYPEDTRRDEPSLRRLRLFGVPQR